MEISTLTFHSPFPLPRSPREQGAMENQHLPKKRQPINKLNLKNCGTGIAKCVPMGKHTSPLLAGWQQVKPPLPFNVVLTAINMG